MENIFFFFLISVIITVSTLGFGFSFTRLLGLKVFDYNYGTIGIIGLFFLSIISSYSHLVISHNYYHNIFLIILGLITFLIFGKKETKDIKIISLIFVILFICIILAKNNEDFSYYHLPNSIQFAQQKLQFGLGNLNHGFKHISTLFMLMSLNYLPIFDYFLFNITNFLFLFFLIIFLTKEIFYRQNYNLNFVQILLCFCGILFLTKFSRLAEYGSDISAQILLVFYTFFILELIFNKKLNFDLKISYCKISSILIIFAITIKFILTIYSILFLLMFFLIEKKKLVLKNLLQFKFSIILLLPLIFLVIFNFSSTGCLIYPVEITCFDNTFDWALPSRVVADLNSYYELWSKAGAGVGYQLENGDSYIKNLNWFSHWFSVYFFNKVSDYLLVIFFIILVFSLFFLKNIRSVNSQVLNLNFKHYIFFISLLIVFLLWFLNFPTLRYAGYIVIFFIFIFPASLMLSYKIDLTKKRNLKKISYVFILSFLIFFLRNVDRIHAELSLTVKDHNNFKNFPFYWIKKVKYEEIIINNHLIYSVNDSCWNVPSTCVRNLHNLKIIKKNGYIFYSY